MSKLKALIKRDTKLFFKDKGMFFTSLITPLILLFLYSTFLNNVYRDTFSGSLENMGNGFTAPDKLINGCVGGQLFFLFACGLLCYSFILFQYAYGSG